MDLLGLSTQVPGRWVYLSDGPSREYALGEDGRQLLTFCKSALKETGFKLRESGLLVQALKALGKERVDSTVIDTLRRRVDAKLCPRILDEIRVVPSWIVSDWRPKLGSLATSRSRIASNAGVGLPMMGMSACGITTSPPQAVRNFTAKSATPALNRKRAAASRVLNSRFLRLLVSRVLPSTTTM